MQPRRYAEGTEVAPEKSRAEIERLVLGRGATDYGYLCGGDEEAVLFRLRGRWLRFTVRRPVERELERTRAGSWRTDAQIRVAISAEYRRRWRALLLVLKAEFEAVDSEVVSFEHVFLAQTVLANGRTVGEWSEGALPELAAGRGQPKLLALGPGRP